ncbi:MAG TPA: response regulator, partial [Polyangiales bacterium]
HYLPGLTGCALVRKLRAMPDYERTPILVISVGGSEVRQEAIDAGATHFMDKPVQLSQLLDTMRSLTSKEQTCQ